MVKKIIKWFNEEKTEETKKNYTVVEINLGLELVYLLAHSRNVCENRLADIKSDLKR